MVFKCFYLLVEQLGMQAVLLGSTRNFSTIFINGGFVREQSTVQGTLDGCITGHCLHIKMAVLANEIMQYFAPR